MFTTITICKLLGISKSTLIRWEKEQKIPRPNKTILGFRTYSLTDLRAILKTLDGIQLEKAQSAIKARIQKNIEESESLLELLE